MAGEGNSGDLRFKGKCLDVWGLLSRRQAPQHLHGAVLGHIVVVELLYAILHVKEVRMSKGILTCVSLAWKNA